MLKRITCFLKGHKYKVLQKFSKTSRRIICTRCGGDWGMNDNVQAVVKWDSELEEMYEVMGHTIISPKF